MGESNWQPLCCEFACLTTLPRYQSVTRLKRKMIRRVQCPALLKIVPLHSPVASRIKLHLQSAHFTPTNNVARKPEGMKHRIKQRDSCETWSECYQRSNGNTSNCHFKKEDRQMRSYSTSSNKQRNWDGSGFINPSMNFLTNITQTLVWIIHVPLIPKR